VRSGDPRERRRCSAWRCGAVYKEWCRSLGALPFPNAGKWLGSTPAGCEVAGKPAEMGAPPWITDCPPQLLTEMPSCEAGHMIAPSPRDDAFEKGPCLAGRSTYAKESARYRLAPHGLQPIKLRIAMLSGGTAAAKCSRRPRGHLVDRLFRLVRRLDLDHLRVGRDLIGRRS
jgi:hypothetical protein